MGKLKEKVEDELNLYLDIFYENTNRETGEELPEKFELTDDIIKGDAKAVELVKDTYKDINTLHGVFYPAYKALIQRLIVTIPFFLASLVCLITSIVLIITDAPNRSDDEGNRWGLFVVCLFVGIVIWFISGRQTKLEVWYEKFNGRSMAVYKNLKDNAITVYLGRDMAYKYSEEEGEWVQIEHEYYMDSRLLFSRFVGRLNLKELKNGNIEVYVKNPLTLNEATKLKSFRAKSARMVLKENKLKSIEYYPIERIWSKGGKRERVNQPQILSVLDINNDFVFEIPKSFISYCEEQGIELPQSNRINYI